MKPGLRRHKNRQARIRETRTANKIKAVTTTELDRAFHAQLAEVTRLRHERIAAANETYRIAIAAARDAHTAARGEAWREYDERRDTILRRLAPEAQVAA